MIRATNKPHIYQPEPWGAPATKGWTVLRLNTVTGLYHGWGQKVGEFTVEPELVAERYRVHFYYFYYSPLRSTNSETKRLQIADALAGGYAYDCHHYANRVGRLGIAPHPHDHDLETLLSLGQPGRAQVQAPIICDFCAMVIEKGGDQEIAA